ncbi:hypothetical protein BJY52DRAFT_1215013 [Lactarius psammicola]|nr:hypothetical protein BJY52DRAFT_1215013 [Lactarius psammicola]
MFGSALFTLRIKGSAGNPRPLLVHPIPPLQRKRSAHTRSIVSTTTTTIISPQSSYSPPHSTPALPPLPSRHCPMNARRNPPSSSSSSSGLSVPALLAIVAVSLFILLLGATLAFMHVRRRRVSQKRADHRKRAAQFQEMHRTGARPYAGSAAPPIPVSLPLSATASADEKGLRYPIKAYVV